MKHTIGFPAATGVRTVGLHMYGIMCSSDYSFM